MTITQSLSVAALFATLPIVACTSSESDDGSAFEAARVALVVPVQLRAVDPTTLRLRLVLNGTPFELDREPWVVQVRTAPGNAIRLSLEWSDDTGLTLATYTDVTDTIERDGIVEVPNTNYVTSRHDEDSDGFSNLEERRCGTDPRVAISRPAGDGGECVSTSRFGAACFASGHIVTLPDESGSYAYRIAAGEVSRDVTLVLTRAGSIEVEHVSGALADSVAELFDPSLQRVDVDDDSGFGRRFRLRTSSLEAGEYCLAHGAFGEQPAPPGGWIGVHEYRFIFDDS